MAATNLSKLKQAAAAKRVAPAAANANTTKSSRIKTKEARIRRISRLANEHCLAFMNGGSVRHEDVKAVEIKVLALKRGDQVLEILRKASKFYSGAADAGVANDETEAKFEEFKARAYAA